MSETELVEVGPDVELTFPVVTEAGFPYGLSCIDCSKGISIGQPYKSQIESMFDGGVSITKLTCVYC